MEEKVATILVLNSNGRGPADRAKPSSALGQLEGAKTGGKNGIKPLKPI
jgi:hypothetical protein